MSENDFSRNFCRSLEVCYFFLTAMLFSITNTNTGVFHLTKFVTILFLWMLNCQFKFIFHSSWSVCVEPGFDFRSLISMSGVNFRSHSQYIYIYSKQWNTQSYIGCALLLTFFYSVNNNSCVWDSVLLM